MTERSVVMVEEVDDTTGERRFREQSESKGEEMMAIDPIVKDLGKLTGRRQLLIKKQKELADEQAGVETEIREKTAQLAGAVAPKE